MKCSLIEHTAQGISILSLLTMLIFLIFRADNETPLENVLKDHLKAFPSYDVDCEEYNSIHIRRKHVWSDALRAISKSSFNPKVPIRVTFIREAGIDEGSLRREFFSLAMAKMAEDSTIFQGPPGSKSFVRNVEGIRKRKFFLAGMFVALSLANGGQGIDCLSETVYSYLCHGSCPEKISPKVDDIVDEKVRKHLDKVERV